jgi:hypothetical protein
MQNEPIEVSLLVIDALNTLGVPYFVGGSLASSVYGFIRTTMDVDLIADLRMQHVEPLVQMLNDAFYIDAAAIREAIRQHRSFNVIHLETMFKVDVFVRKQRPFDQAQFDRRVAQVIATEPERTAYVASAEDTVLAKLEWFRMGGEVSERQWRDVLGVLKVQGERLDQAYLRRWAAALGVSDLLERALSAAGQGAENG